MQKTVILTWIISLIAIPVGCVVMFIFIPDSTWDKWREFAAKNIFKSDYVKVEDQSFRETFIVKSVRLSKPGFVHLLYGDWYFSPGDVIMGYSPFLPAGEFQDVPIDINFPLHMRDQEPWQAVGYVIPFYDNGDGVFHEEDDVVAKDTFGHTIVATTHIPF